MFSLPNELMLSSILSLLPCREQQIKSLATLLSIGGAPSRNIVVYGLEATGKSAVTRGVLRELSASSNENDNVDSEYHELLRYAIVKSVECISGRHLLKQTIGAIAKAVGFSGTVGRCESLAQLAVETGRLLEHWRTSDDTRRRLVLVFDGIDHQRDAPPTLLPALARLPEIIPGLSCIFIVTHPRPHFIHLPGIPHIHFPSYTKPELLQILMLTFPTPQLPTGAKETKEVWTRFTSAVYDSLSKHSGRDILSFRSVCLRLWPRFIRPILEGTHSPTPFSRLLLANRSLFQNDNILVPNIVSDNKIQVAPTTANVQYQGIGAQLPYYSRLLLVAAYLASFNPPRTDQLFFLKTSASKRRKKGGGTALSRGRPGVTKHRKISRKLLGPQAFILERMIAIFHALSNDAVGKNRRGKGDVGGSADLQMGIATLGSLRLLVRVGNGDVLEGGCRYRVAVGWEVVRGVGRSVGVEVEDYLAE